MISPKPKFRDAATEAGISLETETDLSDPELIAVTVEGVRRQDDD